MRQSLLAMAEPSESLEELAIKFAAVLEPLGAGWLRTVPYPGQREQDALVDIGPADSVSVRLREGLLLVHAHTSPYGPGYHLRVAQVLEAMGTRIRGGWTRVEDTTGFWRHRDPDRLRRSFLCWALALWSDERLRTRARPHVPLVSLGLGEGPAEVPTGQVATPTGFKSDDWIKEVRAGLRQALANPSEPLPREARAAFLWWHVEPDARDWIQLGRAICTSDVIWRPMEAGEDAPAQVFARERAVACFEAALVLDPKTPAPLQELQRLYKLLDRQPEAAAIAIRAQGIEHEPFQGGYREGWIRRLLGGLWNLQLPGWLRATCDARDGHDVFWDDRMTVHVTASNQSGEEFSPRKLASLHLEKFPEQARNRAEIEYLTDGEVVGYLVVLAFGPDEPDVDTLVMGQIDRDGERVTFTVVARSPEASAMARRLGRSLRPIV